MEESTVGITQWGVVGDRGMGIGDWSVGNSFDDWSVGDSFDGNSWGRSVDDGVESLDGVSGVGDSSDSTIGFDKGVLALDNISVTGLTGSLGVSGQSIGDGVSVVVLWMRVIRLWLDSNGFHGWDNGFGENRGMGVCDWSVGNWCGI